MRDPQTPEPPAPPAPPPPAPNTEATPPVATAETAAGETAPPPAEGDLTPPEATTDQASLEGAAGATTPAAEDHHAIAAAEGEGMVGGEPPAVQQALSDADVAAAAAATEADRGPTPMASFSYDQIVAAVRHEVIEVDQVPEGEFARDFPLPVEARESLITRVGKTLFPGAPGPQGNQLTNLAVNVANVGELIDLFAEMLDEHPLNSGAGS